jgi:uncharacterized protein (DUF1800 family)
MGDENTVLSTDEVRHVLRRTGFGAPPKALDKLLDSVDSPTRGNIADSLLAFRFRPKPYKPGGKDFDTVHNNWVKYMLNAKSPLQEKLVLFWHDHFATSSIVVLNMTFMSLQIQLLHVHAAGNFRDLMKAININAAMMEMLDTVRNHKEIPNENYARELQELFTLGVYDLAGQPTYTQEDIVQIARAFTGWRHDGPKGDPFLSNSRHDFMDDFPERGPKEIYKTTGGFGAGGADFAANGEGEAEIDTVVDIILQHEDSQGKNTVARRLTQRLLEFFCHGAFASPGAAEIAIIDDIVTDSGFASSWDIASLCKQIFVHDVFFETAVPAPYGPTTKKSVKWPIDYFVSTLRLTGMKLKGSQKYIPARGGGGFRPDKLIDLDLTDPETIVEKVAEVLGVVDQIPPGSNERQILVDYLTDDGANPSLNLFDEDVRNTKLHGLFALVIQSPAYQLH